jgi:tetratricopeptide (TPR) repeat protein
MTVETRLWGFTSAALLTLSAGCAPAPDMDVVQKFQAAQQAFDKAETEDDFLRAASLYQAILDGGFQSGAVLYNQGNALMRGGQRGRALAAYRRAQRYRPRDPLLQHNLAYALQAPPGNARRSTIDYLLFWQDWISYGAKFRLLAIVALATFAIGISAIVLDARFRLSYVGYAGLILTILLGVSAAYDWYRFDIVEHGVVVAEKIVARKGNGESYAPAFTQPLSEGAEFRVAEHRGDWVLIQLAENQEGWVRRDDVTLY